jgi:hypothetical protein
LRKRERGLHPATEERFWCGLKACKKQLKGGGNSAFKC